MSFDQPFFLYLAAMLVPACAFFLWWAWHQKQKAIALFVRSRLLAQLTVGVSRRRQILKSTLCGCGGALILLALARPQWGLTQEEARSHGLDIVVAIDTSKSMLAADLKPSRIERARLAALDLMAIAKEDRLGLVAFAGDAFLQCPLTIDDEAFRQTLIQIDTDIIPQGGTALGQAIDVALNAFNKDAGGHRIIILMTDGEDHETGVMEAVERATKDGARIFTIGVGSASGEVLYTTDPYGNKVFIKDEQGNAVKSRLNEDLLKQIAQKADGFYLPLQNSRTMATLYERGLAPLPKREGSAKILRRLQERFQWPLAFAALILILEVFIQDHRRSTAEEARVVGESPRASGATV
jgi:Ca-activated chloride channel family protein